MKEEELYFYRGHSFKVKFCKLSEEWKGTSFVNGERLEVFGSEDKDWVVCLCKESIDLFLEV